VETQLLNVAATRVVGALLRSMMLSAGTSIMFAVIAKIQKERRKKHGRLPFFALKVLLFIQAWKRKQ